MTAENNKQIWREEIERMHTRFILVHSIQELHPVLSQTTEYFTMQPITNYTHTTQRGDFESHKAYYPLCTQPTPQARITLTLQNFTTIFQRVI